MEWNGVEHRGRLASGTEVIEHTERMRFPGRNIELACVAGGRR